MTEAEIIPPPEKLKRPTDFTDDIFQDICDRMTEGESLSDICESPEMPSKTTFLRWVDRDTGRQQQYQRAREALMDHFGDLILKIAFDDSGDVVKDGERTIINNANVQRAKLQVDSYKWTMSKLSPKRWGEKTELLTVVSDQPTITGISWKPSVRVVVYPMLRRDGSLIKPDSPEYDEAIEKAAREAKARGLNCAEVGVDLQGNIRPPAPEQITYQPEPLPNDLSQEDWSLLTEVLNLIRRTIPTGSNAMPETIMRVMRQALLMHFREVEIETSAEG